jgi:hypothetical protein
MMRSGIKLTTTVAKTSGVSDHTTVGAVNNNGTAYVNFIPKNASSYLRVLLRNESWHELTSANHIMNREYPIAQLALLRDPYERWLSGITQFLFDTFKSFPPFENNWEAIFRIINAQPYQDAHTAPQADFFYNQNLDHYDFFIYIENFESTKDKLKTWAKYTNQNFKNLDSVGQLNRTKEDKIKIKIFNFLTENLNNNVKFKKRIVEYYDVDYKLIEWIGKNKKWIK